MTATWQKPACAIFLLALFGAFAFSQTPESAQILDQTSQGMISLVVYGEDKVEKAKASAVALAEDLVATSYHFVSEAFDAGGLNFKEKKVKVDGILAVDKARNLALIKIKGKVKPLTIGNSDDLEDGARIFAVGSNQLGQIAVAEGTLLRTIDVSPQLKIMEITINVPMQFNGGGLFNLSGELIGMLQVLDRGIKVGIPVNLWKDTPRTGKLTAFKNRAQEDYFSLLEGASLMGSIAASLDEHLTARAYLEKVVEFTPDSLENHLLLADIYTKQRDFKSAAEAYRKVTALDPSQGEAFYGLGYVLMRTSNFAEAIPALEKAVSLNADNKEAFLELGTAYEETEDFASAAEAYEKYLSLNPEVSWTGYLQLGLARMRLEQYDAAVSAFLEAKKDKPEELKVNVSLADAYLKAGQLDKAEETLNFLAEINPDEAKYYYGQAIRMYDTAGNYEAALEPAKKIVALNPQDEMSVYNLGLMYFKQKKYDEAVDTFKQCLAIKPDYAYAWFQIGSAFFNQKKYSEAVEPYRKYAELSPDDHYGWLSLGITYMNIGVSRKSTKEFESALEPMRKAVELKPDNASALFNLGIIYVNLKDYLSARDVLKRLQSLDASLAERLRKNIR